AEPRRMNGPGFRGRRPPMSGLPDIGSQGRKSGKPDLRRLVRHSASKTRVDALMAHSLLRVTEMERVKTGEASGAFVKTAGGGAGRRRSRARVRDRARGRGRDRRGRAAGG